LIKGGKGRTKNCYDKKKKEKNIVAKEPWERSHLPRINKQKKRGKLKGTIVRKKGEVSLSEETKRPEKRTNRRSADVCAAQGRSSRTRVGKEDTTAIRNVTSST